MVKLELSSEFFNVKDTLECGQVFRFKPFKEGYLVFSLDKCAYCYNKANKAIIECESANENYFKNYFDLQTEYSEIFSFAQNSEYDIVKQASKIGKGIRILNQDKYENLFSFIISQNNNIPRIKSIIEKICLNYGEKKQYLNQEYYSFPKNNLLPINNISYYAGVGLGYRAKYILNYVNLINKGLNLEEYSSMPTLELKKNLQQILGVGPKVANCVSLFSFHRTDSFPVDTWLHKVYTENFNGKLTNRDEITRWYQKNFNEYSGYIQQYLFYYKRNIENQK